MDFSCLRYKSTSVWAYEYVMMCLLQVLEVLRGIAENMVAVVNTALKCFSGMQHLLLDGEGAINLRVSLFLSLGSLCDGQQAENVLWGAY